jgi:phosphoserine phosphatase
MTLVVFDIESVLIDGEFFPALAERVGRGPEVQKLTELGIAGKIDWKKGLEDRLKILEKAGAGYQLCKEVTMELPMTDGAAEVVKELKKMGAIVIGISGGPSMLAKRVKHELGMDYVFANDLVFKAGSLVGYKVFLDGKKSTIFNSTFGKFLAEKKKAAVVDGANDLPLFDFVDLRIGYNAQEVVRRRADITLERGEFRQIPGLIRDRLHPTHRQPTTTTIS